MNRTEPLGKDALNLSKTSFSRFLVNGTAIVRIAAISAAAATVAGSALSQELPIVVGEGEPRESQPASSAYSDDDRRAWEARVRVNLISKPEYYPSLLRVFRRPSDEALSRELAFQRSRSEAYEEARTTNTQYLNTFVAGAASLPVGSGKVDIQARVGEISEFQSARDELHQLRLKEESLRRGAREVIERDVDQFDAVLREASRLEYKVARGEPLDPDEQIKFEAFNALIRSGSPQMPTRAGTRQEIIKTSSAPDRITALLQEEGGSPETFIQIVNQNATTQIAFDQRTNVLAFGAIASRRGIEDIEKDMALLRERMIDPQTSPGMTSTIQSALDGLEKQKRALQLAAHEETMRELQDIGFAISEGANLFFPGNPDVQRAVTTFEAATKLYDGVASIAISGLTTGGVGAVLAGAGMLAGMMQSSGPSADQIQIELLTEILEKLVAIQSSIDSQSRRLGEVIQALEALEGRNFLRFHALRETITSGNERLERLSSENWQAAEIQRGPTQLRALQRTADQLNFNADGVYTGEYDLCVRDRAQCSDDAADLHGKFVVLSNDLFGRVTGSLVNFPQFGQDRTVYSFGTRGDLHAFKGNNGFATRLGDLLPSMAVWLNGYRFSELSKLNENSQYAAFSGLFGKGDAFSDPPELVNETTLSDLAAPSSITSVLMPAYADSVEYIRNQNFGSDEDLRTLEASLDEIEAAQRELRRAVPLAAAAATTKLDEILSLLSRLDEEYIWDYEDHFVFDEFGKRVAVSISPYSGRSTLFSEFSDISIVYPDHPDHRIFLHKLSQFLLDADIIELKKRIVYGDSDQDLPPIGENYSYYLSPEIRPYYSRMLDEGKLSRELGLDGDFLHSSYRYHGANRGIHYRAQPEGRVRGLLSLVAFVMDDFESGWLDDIEAELNGSNFERMAMDYARAVLVIETFLMGGYGICMNDTSVAGLSSFARLADEADQVLDELKFLGKKEGYGLATFKALLDRLERLRSNDMAPLMTLETLQETIPGTAVCGFGYANVADGRVALEAVRFRADQ